MRIITGVHKGRKLLADEKKNIRPTTTKTKEAIFSILLSRIGNLKGYKILDLCAGSGNLGLEALSRGAEFCCFIDNNPLSIKYIKYNIQHLGEGENSRVICADVSRLSSSLESYDIVFFDPPYNLADELLENILKKLAQGKWLNRGALLIIETSFKFELKENKLYEAIDSRIYGNTKISILEYQPREADV